MRVAVGLGSNLGHRPRMLDRGRRALEELLSGTRLSRVYRSEPMYVRDQPTFLNLCCVGRAEAEPADLLVEFQAAERKAGREPGGGDGPRPLDLDLLLYGDRRISLPNLEVPHPRMTERGFVLVPLAELIPGVEVPGTGRTVAELARAVGSESVEPLGRLNRLLDGDDARLS